jgi:hypothetical protein
MSSRKSNDSSSQSGVNYATGGAVSSAVVQKNVSISQPSAGSLISLSGGFNGHAVEVWADGAVWDTVSNVFLFPGRDFNVGDLQRK